MRPFLLALALLMAIPLAASAPARAVEPDEMLDDPALEARARALSQEIR
ncbi:MAG: cytochrome C biogenesis protein CcdA, partial [Proteobacteria bacterium]|nr:cytochrome C biogenesis protein CcdA [Pseudomonadota bacterium]